MSAIRISRLAPLLRKLRKPARAAALLAILAVTAVACAHTSKTTVFDDGKLKVQLRSGDAQGLDHPLIISPVRLNHILARVDIRTSVKDGQRRVPAIPLASLEPISNALAAGLAQAKPDEEVVVTSVRIDKRFGIFNHNKLTSFVAYQRAGILFIHLSRSDWEIPPRREDRLPEPKIGEFPTKFRIVEGKSMELIDQQALAIDWRAALFDKPTRTRVTPDGRTVRREILMESEEIPESEEATESRRPDILPIPAGVSPDVLRALADLEEKRRNGSITESRYARERLEILEANANQ
jgi:hypothetical protein